MTDQAFLGTIQLLSGAHKRGQGMCAMEAAAYLAGEEHSDHPECVSPVIASFMRGWNDGMRSDAERELLKPWVVKVLHTRTTDADEQRRGFLALDWLVRVHTPVWLDLAGIADHAANLRNLPALTTTEITLDAARAAAKNRLEPTVQQLQASAFALLDRMIAVGTPREAPIVAAKDPVNA